MGRLNEALIFNWANLFSYTYLNKINKPYDFVHIYLLKYSK